MSERDYEFVDETARDSLHKTARTKVAYGQGYSCSIWRGRDGAWRSSDHYRRQGEGQFAFAEAVRAPSFFSMAHVMDLIATELSRGVSIDGEGDGV